MEKTGEHRDHRDADPMHTRGCHGTFLASPRASVTSVKGGDKAIPESERGFGVAEGNTAVFTERSYEFCTAT